MRRIHTLLLVVVFFIGGLQNISVFGKSPEFRNTSSSKEVINSLDEKKIARIYNEIEKNLLFNLFKNLKPEIANQELSQSDLKAFLALKSKNTNSSSSVSVSADPCPDIDFIDLRNVPGYPQIDDITSCGAADTLSMIIFTGDPGEIVGFEFEIDLPEGIEYAGWEYSKLGNTSISNIDPKASRPVFLVNGITGDSLVIVNIGLREFVFRL